MVTQSIAPPVLSHPAGSPWPLIDAARYLKVSHRHLVRLIDADKVKTIRFGRRRLIPAAELERLALEGSN